LDASYKLKRYDKRTFSDLGDEDRLLVNGAFRHRMAPDFHGFLFAGYDQPSFQNGVRGDYRGYLGGVGLERQFNDQWKGSIALGYEFLDYQDAAEHDTSLPYVKAAAQARPGARLTVDAEAEYSLEPSDRSLYSSKEYLRLLMRGTLALSESLSAFGQAVYANGAYDAKSGIEDETRRVDDQAVVDGDDTLVDLQVGLLFRPQTGRYTGRLAYEFEDWDSDVRESFTRNTMMASVSVDF